MGKRARWSHSFLCVDARMLPVAGRWETAHLDAGVCGIKACEQMLPLGEQLHQRGFYAKHVHVHEY
jgi:hypothetical protein